MKNTQKSLIPPSNLPLQTSLSPCSSDHVPGPHPFPFYSIHTILSSISALAPASLSQDTLSSSFRINSSCHHAIKLPAPFGAHTTWNLNIHHSGGGGVIGRAYWQKACWKILSPPLASYIWPLGVPFGLHGSSFIYIWYMNKNSCPPYLHEIMVHFNVQMLTVHLLCLV